MAYRNRVANRFLEIFEQEKIMKRLFLIALVLLTGCASLQDAGDARYSLTPIFDKDGHAICCAVTIANGKEIANIEVHASKTGDDYVIDLKEQGVAAFEGQKIAADAFKSAVAEATKAAVAAFIAPLLPTLAPMAGAALSSPGIGAAAIGAGTAIEAEKLTAPAKTP
jgi:hypothetical protein